MKILLRSLIISFYIFSLSYAQELKWEALGPTGNNHFFFAIDSKDKNSIYAVANIGFKGPSLIFRNADTGWEYYTTVPGEIDQLTIDKKDNTRYTGTSLSGVYSSTDKGLTWEFFPLEKFKISGMELKVLVKNVVVHPDNSDIIYACCECYSKDIRKRVVLISRNGGRSWDNSTPDISGNTSLSKIFINPYDSNIFYLSGFEINDNQSVPVIFKSTDGGKNFTRIKQFYKDDIFNIVFDPKNKEKLFAVSHDAVLISNNSGASWSIGKNYPEKPVIIFPLVKDNSLVAVSRYEVYRSTDDGNTWTKTNNFHDDAYIDVQRCDSKNDTVFISQKDGLYFLEPGAVEWKKIKNNFTTSIIYEMEMSPSSPGTVIFSIGFLGVYQAAFAYGTDYAKSAPKFERLSKIPFNCHFIRDIEFAPDNYNIIYAYDGG